MIKKRFLSMLVLLAAVATGAMAQTEELLTTITLGGEPWSLQPVYTESGRATLETSGTVDENMVRPEIYGWSNSSPLAIGSVTINPAEGYTITKVVFWDYDMNNGYYNALTDNASPFTCYMKGSQRSLNEDMSSPNGYAIAKIEVYGYASTVAVTGVTLLPTSATLTLGETETVTLIPTVLPAEATDKSVTWSSSDEAVATVTDGVVTAVAAGEATITVTTTDGAKTATCAVTVAAPANACGDGVTWALDNGVLTISYAGSGTGAMADFTESWESNPTPWKDNLYGITSIVIEEGVTSIGKMAFKDCDMLTSVSIPATVTSIGENAFANSGSSSGMTVTIAAGSALETIGTYAFTRSKLASINLPNGVTTIGDFAFAVCEKLASFTWPSSLTSIGMRAFQRTALTTVEIPATLTSIGELAFMACSSLATITVADGNSAYEAPNGCNALIDKNSHTLIQGCSGTVFEILPADLTTIGYASCSYFGFTSVTIPDGVTTIGEHAFEGCSDLTTVEIPASVTSIGEFAFGWCGSLATVTVYAEPTCALGDEAFYDCSSLAAIYVPSDKVNDFKTATGWSAYESIIDAIPAPATYTVTLKEGTEDATSWTIAPAEATTTGVAAGTEVKATYGGTKKVKSVKAVKKAAPAAKAAAEATAEDKGKLIGTDGKIYADVAAATAAGTTAVAKIIYIGTTGHATYSHGLALALTDEGHMTWGAAMTACNTTKNTNTPVTGATWLLASKDQWNYMLGTSGAGSYTALRDGFSGITGASNLQSSGLYWSSTEDDDRAWYLRFSNGNWQLGVKSNTNFYVRACLAF